VRKRRAEVEEVATRVKRRRKVTNKKNIDMEGPGLRDWGVQTEPVSETVVLPAIGELLRENHVAWMVKESPTVVDRRLPWGSVACCIEPSERLFCLRDVADGVEDIDIWVGDHVGRGI
jgi:hypothetical protein